ncbi:MAG: zinc ribbon domain-containing protein [Ignavibacteriales bacterium]|nr:zinc ribbon domain-containing protein [Ignavibacteriales bacterium]
MSNSANNHQYRLCSKCGNFSNVLERQSFCILCGTKLIDQCIQCNEPILHPYGKFCYHCGAPYLMEPYKEVKR